MTMKTVKHNTATTIKKEIAKKRVHGKNLTVSIVGYIAGDYSEFETDQAYYSVYVGDSSLDILDIGLIDTTSLIVAKNSAEKLAIALDGYKDNSVEFVDWDGSYTGE